MITVEVFMSTYNGEKFLHEQIDSVLNQKDVRVMLSVRDDGSTDGTLLILREYEKQGKLKLYAGKNIYITKSFFSIINHSNQEADYFAFSDQDDFWREDKLITAVTVLEKVPAGVPALYYSSLDVVDSELNFIGNISKKKNNFATSLVINEVAGCTMVFNKSLLLANANYKGSNARMHDHWFYLLCCGLNGDIYYDKNSYILYRQHGGNTVGGLMNYRKRIKILIDSVMERRNERIKQIEDFNMMYGDQLDAEKQSIIEEFLMYRWSAKTKIKLMFRSDIQLSRQKKFLFILALMTNLL